jgi:hypothetical protein
MSSIRFGLGKVHEQLMNSPPVEAATTGEGEEEGGEEVEKLPWELPEDVTRPEYR